MDEWQKKEQAANELGDASRVVTWLKAENAQLREALERAGEELAASRATKAAEIIRSALGR